MVRLVAVGLAGITVVLLSAALGTPQAASAAAPRTVTVTPGHGVPGEPFTVEYREPVGLLFGPCSAGSVTVTYDGAAVGTAPLHPQRSDCVATLPSTSRGGPGRHDVRIAGTSVATTYTVDPPPSPRIGPADPASPGPAGSADSGRSPTPSGTPGTAPASASYLPTPPDGRSTTLSARAISMPGPDASGSGSATPWLLTIGGMLILGDLCLLALLTIRTRRATQLKPVEEPASAQWTMNGL